MLPVAVVHPLFQITRNCPSVRDVRPVLVFAVVKSSSVAIVRIAPLFTDLDTF